MEEFYDKDIDRYYSSLQMGLNHNYYFGRNEADLTAWITYFLEVMAEVFERVSKKVAEIYKQGKDKNTLFDTLDKRERWVANYIKEKGFIKTKDIVSYFKIDKKTARNWIEIWIKEGFIEQKNSSQKRNIEYILAPKYVSGI